VQKEEGLQSMKKICIFCETWESGGIEQVILNLLSQLDLSSASVNLVVEELRESVFTAKIQALGVSILPLSGSTRRVFANYKCFEALLQKKHYDVVHINCYQGLSLAYLHLAKRAGVPVRIAHSHNNALRKSATRPAKLFLHYCARELFGRSATLCWACSVSAGRFMFGRGVDFSYLPNGIELSKFIFDPKEREKQRRQLGMEDALIIGHIGRLCYQKNQEFLLEVFAEVCKANKTARLLLVGDSEERPLLEQQAKTLGISSSVCFYGTTKTPEKLYSAMDVFAFPSRFEGLGIVAIEAQCAGLPVLAADEVPKEAGATKNYHTLPLEAGAKAWANALLNMARKFPREEGAELLEQAGFSLSAVAKQVSIGYGLEILNSEESGV
jgi:glycosyltransferase involved in cell wall biosynthesis